MLLQDAAAAAAAAHWGVVDKRRRHKRCEIKHARKRRPLQAHEAPQVIAGRSCLAQAGRLLLRVGGYF